MTTERVQVEGDVVLSQWHRKHTPVPITPASFTLTWLSLVFPQVHNILEHVPRLVPGWVKPIVIGRHAFGDQYRATDFLAPGPVKLQLVFTPEGGGEWVMSNVYDFKGKGVTLAMNNTDDVCPCFYYLYLR